MLQSLFIVIGNDYILLFEYCLSSCELLFPVLCGFFGKVLWPKSENASKNNNPLLARYVQSISPTFLFDFQFCLDVLYVKRKNDNS